MGEAEYATQLPMPALRPYVGRYVGYRMRGFEPGIHRGLPSRHLTFIVTFDAPLELAGMPGASQPPGRFAATPRRPAAGRPLGLLRRAPSLGPVTPLTRASSPAWLESGGFDQQGLHESPPSALLALVQT